MHLDRRLMLSLFGAVAMVSMGFALYQVLAEMHALKETVERQALVLAESQRGPAEKALQQGSSDQLQALVDQFQNHERMAGVAVYNERAKGHPLAITSGLELRLSETPAAVTHVLRDGGPRSDFIRLDGQRMHVLALPLHAGNQPIGAIAFFHNVAFVTASVWRHAVLSVAQTLLIVGMTLLIVHWSLGKPLHHMAQWLRDLRTGNASAASQPPQGGDISARLTAEVRHLATACTWRVPPPKRRPACAMPDSPIGRPNGCALSCRAS